MRLIFAVSVLFILVAPGPGAAQIWPFERKVAMISVDRAPTTISPVGGGRVEAERVTMMVPENRSRSSSRALAVRFIRIPARKPEGLPPVLVLADGPAIAAAEGARWPLYRAISEVADVVLLDPRGTGISDGPLDCASSAGWEGKVADRATFVRLYRQAFGECDAYWRALGHDLRGYTLHESAEDIAAIADLLGGKVSLLGTGSGAQLALAAIRHHPGKVERAVLISVRGLEQSVRSPVAGELYLERLQRVIDQDREALDRFPDIRASIIRLTERLDRDPVTLTIADDSGAITGERTIGGFFVQRLVARSIRNPEQLDGLLDGLWRAEAHGDYGYFESRAAELLPERVELRAAPTLNLVSQGAGWGRLEVLKKEARRAAFGDALSFPMPHILRKSRYYRLREGYRRRPGGRTPTLVLAGTLDGLATPEEAIKATRGLKSARTVVRVENAGRDLVFATPEIVPMITAFLSREKVKARTLTAPLPDVSPGGAESAAGLRRPNGS